MDPDKVARLRAAWEAEPLDVVKLKLANNTLGGGWEGRQEAGKWVKEKEQEEEARRDRERKEDVDHRRAERFDVRFRWWIVFVVGILGFVVRGCLDNVR